MRTKKFAVFVLLAALGGDTERVYQQKIASPPRIVRTGGTPVHHEKPNPEMDIETLMESLETVEDLEEFLKANAKHQNPWIWDFFRTFRQPPEKFQANGFVGPCNNFIELIGRWVVEHGGSPVLVSTCPYGDFEKPHQMVVCRTGPNHLTIFENTTVHDFDGTFDEFLKSSGRRAFVLPVGGRIPWTGTVPDAWRAKFWDHLQWNVPEEDFKLQPLPRREDKNKPPENKIIT